VVEATFLLKWERTYKIFRFRNIMYIRMHVVTGSYSDETGAGSNRVASGTDTPGRRPCSTCTHAV